MNRCLASGTVLTATPHIRTDCGAESPSGGQIGDIRGHRICYLVYAHGTSRTGLAKLYTGACAVDP